VLALERPGDHHVDQYLYLPAVGKARKLTGLSQREAFLGSDFSYEDLLREIPETKRYERRADETVQDLDCYTIRAFEKDGDGSAYAYRDISIAKDTFHLIRVLFYDRDAKLVKTLVAYDYDTSGERKSNRPRRAVMTASGLGTWTDFLLVEGRMGKEFPPNLFTTERIESWTSSDVEAFIFDLGVTVGD
jgi:hypothetical protein